DLAPVVDVGDLDLDLIADVELVLNLLDPAVAADIRDVQQTVAPRQQGDEGTEGGGLHNRAKEAVPDLRLLRIGDRIDLLDRSLGGLAAHGGDEHGAVVLDGDVGAGLLRDLVDGLALRADDLTNLVLRDGDLRDAWRQLAHLVRRVDGVFHQLQDLEAGAARLAKRGSQHLRRQAIELGVQLQGGDVLGGAGDLEVHVTEGVLRTEDVGEADELLLAIDEAGDQAHRDTGHRRLQRHAGVV